MNLGTTRLEALYKMVTRGKVANVNSLYVKSILAFENGRYSDAAQLSGKCVSINPENGQYQRHLGKICAEAGWWAQAVTALNRAIYLNPYEPESWYGLGLVFKRLERYEKAKICFEQCVLLEPRFLEARHALTEMK